MPVVRQVNICENTCKSATLARFYAGSVLIWRELKVNLDLTDGVKSAKFPSRPPQADAQVKYRVRRLAMGGWAVLAPAKP
jgi:hypothetical protein